MSDIIDVGPRFRVVSAASSIAADERTLLVEPGAAFGDGRHPTTQMCIQALAAFAPRSAFRMLDVGSGTGILAIAAAKLGGTAIGIDNDVDTLPVAVENGRRNGVTDRVHFASTWPTGDFEVVVANILRGILSALAEPIVERLAVGGTLVLSGLVSTDVPEIIARYSPLLGGKRPDIFERAAWRALVWRL